MLFVTYYQRSILENMQVLLYWVQVVINLIWLGFQTMFWKIAHEVETYKIKELEGETPDLWVEDSTRKRKVVGSYPGPSNKR